MTDKNKTPRIAALRNLEEFFASHGGSAGENGRGAAKRRALRRARALSAAAWWRIRGGMRRPLLRKLFAAAAGVAAILLLCVTVLWWRLAYGPIALDLATPWLTQAIVENVGSRHSIEIGGTQIERDEGGHISLRIRDILVRDGDGVVVASAPKAEVAISTAHLLFGSLRATRVSLVGAELAVRIETDGQVTISTGAERRPLAVTPAIVKPAIGVADGTAQTPPAVPASRPPQTGVEAFATFLAWIDNLGAAGLEAEGLGEIGLKGGSLSVDDQRTGKQWKFENINLSVNRPRRGGIIFSLSSENLERPWLLTAAVTPSGYQRRSVQIEARRVSTKDVLLALRVDEGKFQTDIPISGVIRAEIGPDFLPEVVEGRILAEAGTIGDPSDPENVVYLDRAEFSLDWDGARKSLVVPFQVKAGGNRMTLLSQFDAPREPDAPWRMTLTGGSIVLAGPTDEEPLILNRVIMRAALDLAQKRFVLEQGDIGGGDVRLVFSGKIDYAGAEPRLDGSMAGTPMSGQTAKRIWPIFVAPKVRNWVVENIHGGTITSMTIASDAPLETLKEGGRPMPDRGLSVDVVVKDAVIQPLPSLPPIREADMTTKITGRTATINVARGVVELASGKRLTLTNGVFEIPDHFVTSPPAKVRFRVEGSIPAAAEFLALDELRDASNPPIDATNSRGTFSGQVNIGLPIAKNPPAGSMSYQITADVSNFGVDRAVLGQKLEAQALQVTANPQGYQITGDVKFNGSMARVEYVKQRDNPEAELRIATTVDDAARARLGFDSNGLLSGPVAVKLNGRVLNEKDARFSVDADLSTAKIDNLLPGWVKPAGKPARATFTLASKSQSMRFDDLVIEGSGAQVKGSVELDGSGEIAAANFPVFAMSEGDKATLKADRTPDGALRVALRGDVYDVRNFMSSLKGTATADTKTKKQPDDLDLDIRVGVVMGNTGEAIRGIDLKMSRRGGLIRSLNASAKIGRDASLAAELRSRASVGMGTSNRPVIYVESGDAGALFRFTGMYPRMQGGQMWIAIDAPTPDHGPQDGVLNVRDFAVRGEAQLDQVASQAANGQRAGVDFTRLRAEFTKTPGKLIFRDGVVRGPVIGGTMDGTVDYVRNDVHIRGTLVPLYGLNNAFGQIPIVGLLFGGGNEGMFGVTYELVGPPDAPTPRVNPISAIAPGILRKVFEFPVGSQDRAPLR